MYCFDGIGIGMEKGIEPAMRFVRYAFADAMYITIFTAVSTAGILRASTYSSVYIQCNSHCTPVLQRFVHNKEDNHWIALQT